MPTVERGYNKVCDPISSWFTFSVISSPSVQARPDPPPSHIWRCEQGHRRRLANQHTMAACVEPARLIYVPRETRIPPPRGTSYDELSPEEWVAEVRRVVSARSMGGLEGADYAISHLDGNARREVLALPPDDVETAELVCTVVCREFGEQRSAAVLREALYGRHEWRRLAHWRMAHRRKAHRRRRKAHRRRRFAYRRRRFAHRRRRFAHP